MTVLPILEQQLADAADRLGSVPSAANGAPARRNARRLRRVSAFAIACTLLLAVAALATVALLDGAPVASQPGHGPLPGRGLGAARPGTMRVLAIRVTDPSGGVPWGLGVFTTTRGVACPIVGRVVDETLGVLGIDYAFGDDGRFHPLLPSVSIGWGCAPLDARGHLYLTGGQAQIAVANGDVAPSAAVGLRPHCDLPGEHNWGVGCPLADLRILYYGFLGPQARTVSYVLNGTRHVQRTSGPDGGYLVVLPAPPGTAISRGTNLGHVGPAPTIQATYTDGRTCKVADVQAPPAPGFCALVGYVPPRAPLPPPDRLATPVRATFVARLVRGAALPYRVGFPAKSVWLAGIRVALRARVAINNTQSVYGVQIFGPASHACRRALQATGGVFSPLEQQTDRTIAAGQQIHFSVPLQPFCPGRYSGRVYFYRDTSPRAALVPILAPRVALMTNIGATVGTFTVNIPR